MELLKDLKRDDFPAKLEAIPNEVISVMLRPLCCELERPSESERDLKSKLLSVKPEAEPKELVKDRAKPFVSDEAGESEPMRILNSDIWSTKPELVIHESPNDLNKETLSAKLEADANDIVRDRKMEVFSEKIKEEPIETDKFTARPLKKDSAKLNESPKDLK